MGLIKAVAPTNVQNMAPRLGPASATALGTAVTSGWLGPGETRPAGTRWTRPWLAWTIHQEMVRGQGCHRRELEPAQTNIVVRRMSFERYRV